MAPFLCEGASTGDGDPPYALLSETTNLAGSRRVDSQGEPERPDEGDLEVVEPRPTSPKTTNLAGSRRVDSQGEPKRPDEADPKVAKEVQTTRNHEPSRVETGGFARRARATRRRRPRGRRGGERQARRREYPVSARLVDDAHGGGSRTLVVALVALDHDAGAARGVVVDDDEVVCGGLRSRDHKRDDGRATRQEIDRRRPGSQGEPGGVGAFEEGDGDPGGYTEGSDVGDAGEELDLALHAEAKAEAEVDGEVGSVEDALALDILAIVVEAEDRPVVDLGQGHVAV